jgi:Na+/H+ antiporter NhaD/arsenite permease-like protein
LPLWLDNINYIAATVLHYRLFIYILDSKNNLRSEHDRGKILTLKRELIFPLFVYVFVIVLTFIKTDFAGIAYLAFALKNNGSGVAMRLVLPRLRFQKQQQRLLIIWELRFS